LRLVPALFLVAGLIGLLGFSRPVHLVKIQKSDGRLWDILMTHQIQVIQELQSCFLARAERQEIYELRREGVSVTVLDRDARNKPYLLLAAPSAEVRSELDRRGRLLAVEPETLLFWTETDDPLAVLPPGLPRKPLPAASILSYLEKPYPLRLSSIQDHRTNDIVGRLVNEVSAGNLRSIVQALQDFQTRYVSTPNCEAAAQFIYNYLQSLGLDVRFQDVLYAAGAVAKNVIAELPGRVYPKDIVIICGHYDSTSNQQLTLAPGADDNASGTAAVMEAARILRSYPLDFTVRCIAFAAEEIGLYGSRTYAQAARNKGENIVGVINLDMIAFADQMPEDLEIIVNQASEWLGLKFLAVSGAYGLVPAKKTINASMVYSDHAAFWETGYSALLGIEDTPLQNPYYHKTTDTLDTLNFDFFREATKATLAELAELAQPVRTGYPATPAGLNAEAYVYRSLFSALQSIELTWPAGSGASGYNVYRSEISHLGYQKLNSSPLSSPSYIDRGLSVELPYYYVITVVGPSGLESNYSREAVVRPWLSESLSLLIAGYPSFQGGRR